MVHLLDEIHPGEILHEEFMKPMRVGAARGPQYFSRKTVAPCNSFIPTIGKP